MEVFIGYDSPHPHAFATAAKSVRLHTDPETSIRGLALADLQERGLYTRPTERRDGKLWDVISEAPMSTEFANSRFLFQELGEEQFSMFVDCDILVRRSMAGLFQAALDSPGIALWCVKHPAMAETDVLKMDGQPQTYYARKNWTSVMLINRQHPANRWLSLENVNSVPGRDLHRLCWLKDSEIGALEPKWNWLVNVQPQPDDVALAHFTLGGPWLPEFQDVPLASEWHAMHRRWVNEPH